jgi:hypothetical protein
MRTGHSDEDLLVVATASTRKPDDRAACVLSSQLQPALLAVASGVPVVAVSVHPKVTETFASMGRGPEMFSSARVIPPPSLGPATW